MVAIVDNEDMDTPRDNESSLILFTEEEAGIRGSREDSVLSASPSSVSVYQRLDSFLLLFSWEERWESTSDLDDRVSLPIVVPQPTELMLLGLLHIELLR